MPDLCLPLLIIIFKITSLRELNLFHQTNRFVYLVKRWNISAKNDIGVKNQYDKIDKYFDG